MFELRSKTKWYWPPSLESNLIVQPPSPLEFPGSLTPPPPWNFQFPPWWESGYFLEPHILTKGNKGLVTRLLETSTRSNGFVTCSLETSTHSNYLVTRLLKASGWTKDLVTRLLKTSGHLNGLVIRILSWHPFKFSVEWHGRRVTPSVQNIHLFKCSVNSMFKKSVWLHWHKFVGFKLFFGLIKTTCLH